MLIKATKWETQRLIGILRGREVVKSQYDWADSLAERWESLLLKAEERKGREAPWKKKN